ncbi:hypothetical protein MCEMIH15_01916 [Caulobacteraceae bacterium]
MANRLANLEWSKLMWFIPALIVGLFVAITLRFPINLPLLGRSTLDTNPQMTFSCHGDRTIKLFGGVGYPKIENEKVSHSITFWRRSNDPQERMRSMSSYKTEKYSLNGSMVNLYPSNKVQFADTERLGFISIRDDSGGGEPGYDCGQNGCVFNKDIEVKNRQSISFNFISLSLTVFESNMNWNKATNSGQETRQVSDITVCERVTDPRIIEELSVIRWSN